MSAIAVLGVTNLLTPLSYASAADVDDYDGASNPISTAKSFSFIMPAHHVYLYAVTEANHYFVDYGGNGHTSGTTPSSEFVYDDTGTIADNGYVKTGYTFSTWNTQSDGEGTSYAAGASVKNLTGTQSGRVDMFAQWTANRYNIHYDLNDSEGTSTGVHSKEPTSGKYDDELTILNASREGYTFSGWYITGMDSNPHIISGATYNGETKDHETATSYSQLRADDGDVYFAARWDPNPNTSYKVRHYLQDINGEYGTGEVQAEDTEDKTGTTDTEVKPTPNTYLGYDNTNTAYSGNINADGSTVFFYHYPRERHNLTLNAGRGIATVTATGTKNTEGISTNTSATTGFLYEEPIVLSYVVKPGYTGATWSGYLDDASSFTMTGENIEKTAYADTIEYTVTYHSSGADVHEPVNPTTYTVENGFTISDAPRRSHSNFLGWIGSNGETPEPTVTVATGTYGNLEYYAKYSCKSGYKLNDAETACIPREDTEYKVNHLLENLTGGYTNVLTETLTGRTESGTNAVAKDYVGFTAESPIRQETISGDVVVEVDITYKRNTNTITMVDATGTTEGFSGQYSTGSNYKYGDTITLSHAEEDGYTWSGWTVTYTSGTETIDVTVTDGNKFTMPDGPVTITPHVITEHYIYTLNKNDGSSATTGGYTVEDTVEIADLSRDHSVFQGWTGTDLASATTGVSFSGRAYDSEYYAVWECVPGYHDSADKQSCVANEYTVSINYKDDGNDKGDRIVTVTGTYGDLETIPNPEQSGYTFAGWTISSLSSGATVDGAPLDTPTANNVMGTGFENLTTTSGGTVTFVANWTANTNTEYEVHHYYRDLSGNYVASGVDYLSGTTNATVTFDPDRLQNYSGFVYSGGYEVATTSATRPEGAGVTSTQIKKDGTTVIDLYYDRVKFHVYLSGDANVDPTGFTGERDYLYGEEVTVDMTPKTGYHFKEWRKKLDSTFSSES